jgi:hypothetical protein
VPVGRHAIVIRFVGFAPLLDTVEVKAGASEAREFILVPIPRELDSVRVVSEAPKYRSPGLRDFEARRKAGFGYFIGEEVLRRPENTRMSSVLSRIPGLNLVPFRSSSYAQSGRSAGSRYVVPADPSIRGSPRGCWVSLYIDGVQIYSAKNGAVPAPDFARIEVSDFAGIEFYHGGASIPQQYNATDSGCGVLLLWTRER